MNMLLQRSIGEGLLEFQGISGYSSNQVFRMIGEVLQFILKLWIVGIEYLDQPIIEHQMTSEFNFKI